MSYVSEHFTVSKPAVSSRRGLVSAQHHEAAAAGAEVLRRGGNAVDAAVATALALGAVEPWMSGIGGGGFMQIYDARTGRVSGVDFGMVAPKALDPSRYALAAGTAAEAGSFIGFVWKRVIEDRNMKGAESVCVPGAVAGLALALEKFGTLSWAEAIEPAVGLAEQGLAIDWYTTLQIAYGMAAGLGDYDESRRVYLPAGGPPVSMSAHAPQRIVLGNLPRTMKRLAEKGPRDFYEGEIAKAIARDMQAAGGALSLDDLASYRASTFEPAAVPYRGATVHLVPGYTGGPTFARALKSIERTLDPASGLGPDAYLAWAAALDEAYAYRFANLGHDGDQSLLTCTTHLSVVDEAGNMVTLTNTLLERFGSRMMLPESGILMNDGIMWFDPEPGKANSIAAGKRPLSNMSPVIATRSDGPVFALGASGGRRIVPACFQLTSLLLDFGMSLDEAYAVPRIDVSGEPAILADRRLDPAIVAALQERHPVTVTEQAIGPKSFANPQTVLRDGDVNWGACATHSPTAKVVAAD